MFGAPTGSGPCVTEPEDGALFPSNWLRPRVRVPGSTGLLKITFHADREANDLVAYASGETWSLPKSIWSALASHVVDEDVTVAVQTLGGGATAVKFRIAPAAATGSIVFFAMDPTQAGKADIETMSQTAIVNDASLKGFAPGDEATVDVLKITDVQQQVATLSGNTQGSHCIGCHVGPRTETTWGSSTPGRGAPVSPTSTADLRQACAALHRASGASCTSWNNCTVPATYVQYPWMGPMAFSTAHWSPGDQRRSSPHRCELIGLPWNIDDFAAGQLVWMDTESTADHDAQRPAGPHPGHCLRLSAHTGDPPRGRRSPPGATTATDRVRLDAGPLPGSERLRDSGRAAHRGRTDLYAVPYNNNAGGAASPVPGASTTSREEYYPSFSPDDQLIAYTAVPAGQQMYANPNAEIFVVPRSAGTTAIRLRANDPPACSGRSSPGINNHWPRFAPVAPVIGGRTYYWLVFSTNHYGLPTVTTNFNATTTVVAVSQLYVTAIVVDEMRVTTYPAVYLWNQPQNLLNTTPAWENFHIPAVVN